MQELFFKIKVHEEIAGFVIGAILFVILVIIPLVVILYVFNIKPVIDNLIDRHSALHPKVELEAGTILECNKCGYNLTEEYKKVSEGKRSRYVKISTPYEYSDSSEHCLKWTVSCTCPKCKQVWMDDDSQALNS